MRNGPYELVKAPAEYPGRTYRGSRRYVYAHHLEWWRQTGRLVPPGSLIHHKNENPRDNRFENLELKSWGEHSSEHTRSRGSIVVVECGWCGAEIVLATYRHRERIKNSSSGLLFCSRSHQVKFWHQRRSCSRGGALPS